MGTNWCLATALEHIERIEANEWHQQFYRDVLGDQTIELGANISTVGDVKVSPETAFTALNGLLLALRDGYVRATAMCARRADGLQPKGSFPKAMTRFGVCMRRIQL